MIGTGRTGRVLVGSAMLAVVLVGLLIGFGGCGKHDGKGRAAGKKVIIIGADGMDPIRVERLMSQGRLPNLARLRSEGGFRRLTSSIPPQSAVAWSDFITGAGAGIHGIFDFIHRDPDKQAEPYWSGNKIVTVEDKEPWSLPWPLKGYQLPRAEVRNELRRRGVPFWEHLDADGIPVHMYHVPANYPPSESRAGNAKSLSEMGVPDALGNQGTYQQFSSARSRDSKSGEGYRLRLRNDYKSKAYVGKLYGPPNEYQLKAPELYVDLSVYPDPENDVAKIVYVNKGLWSDETVELVLDVGEWSEWQQVRFPKTPIGPVYKTMVRFLVQEVRPELRVFTNPLNFVPTEPEIGISAPADFVEEIAEDVGPFFTQGFAEQFNALKHGIFSDEEFRVQSQLVLDERLKMLEYALDHFDEGLLFFYFSSTDLQSHMFWWDTDAKHPTRSPEDARKYDGVVDDVYTKIDAAIGHCRERAGNDATILVMSDHGFCNFRRGVAINTWLRDEGYLAAKRGLLLDTDWSKTRAYSIGVEGSIYLNLRGREKQGMVEASERGALLTEISDKLMQLVDPQTGRPVFHRIYRSDQCYSGPEARNAPDLIPGYERDYRASWNTCLGDFDKAVIVDNELPWAADHCADRDLVPGVLFSNKRITLEDPALIDIAPSVLAEFGIARPGYMTGRNFFESPRKATEKVATR
jgi:predicted AlkP superfamily phosphohydrolase/phosphomutase